MKICPNCRDENDDSSNFCRRCRAPFETPGKSTCPRGHIIDPTWSECPYCKAEGAGPSPDPYAAMPPPGRSKTVVESPGQNVGMPPPMPLPPTVVMQPPSGPPPGMQPGMMPPPPPSLAGRPPAGPGPGAPVPPPQSFGAPTPPQPPPSAAPPQAEPAPRRKTVFIPPEAAGEAAQSAPTPQPGQVAQSRRTPDRRIVGVLVTYSWKPEGQVFAVREGRNLIGRGAECEVSIPEDSTLSNVNSHITYRKSFVIGDMVSMSGTDLNGLPIEEQFVPLPNYATIRTGSTQWTFMAIQPAPASASASAGESPEKT